MPLIIDQLQSEGLVDLKSLRVQVANTVASASTLSLLVTSEAIQAITGSTAGQIVKLPDATTLQVGQLYEIWNMSSVNLTVQDNSAAALVLLAPGERAYYVLLTATPAAGVWMQSVLTKNSSADQFTVTYPGAGLLVNYTGGIGRFNSVSTTVSAGSVTVGASITGGFVYVDIDGAVKAGTTLPINAMALAQFTSSASAITSLSDARETVDQNLVFGVVGDIVSNLYNRAASAGVLEKFARADHSHANNALLNRAGVVPGASFAGSPKKFTVAFTVAMPSANYAINITSGNNRTFTYETRTTAGFTINANANAAMAQDVSWEAIITGEAS